MILFLILTILLSAFQSVIWYQFFGHFVAPYFSFILFTYFGLDKDSWRSLIYCYGIVYLNSFFTYSSIGMLYMSSMVSFVFLFLVKNRVYWPGPAYFTIMTSAGLFLFHLTYIITSFTSESHTTPLMIFQRLAQIAMTSLCAYFFYEIIKKLDTSLKSSTLTEIKGETHG